MKKYQIRFERMGGDYYYMIYRKGFFSWSFFERWNTGGRAIMRVDELNGDCYPLQCFTSDSGETVWVKPAQFKDY